MRKTGSITSTGIELSRRDRPHIRRNAVDSNFYTQTSMIRTIQEIFRIPPKTRYLAAARPMTSIFQPKAEAARSISVRTPHPDTLESAAEGPFRPATLGRTAIGFDELG